jgi:sodium-coupled monocarboxylate transporter 8/12
VWLTGAVCIFYTSIGGLKAVVWTDTVQLFVMLSGFVGIIVQGCIDFGLGEIMDNYRAGARNVWGEFSFDPRIRHTFWSIVMGGVFGLWGNNWCATQSQVQRMLACRNKKDMRIALYTAWRFICMIPVVAALTGRIMFRYYQCCDPLRAGYVESRDQQVPYLAVNLFQQWPGVAGLYIAGAYCGTLSSVSSGINSMTTVIVTDFIKPYEKALEARCKFPPSEKFYLIFSKLLSAALGLICIAFAYVAHELGEIMEASLSLNNIIGGAHFAIYVLAILNPYANRWGAHIGFMAGLATSACIYIGAKSYDLPLKFSNLLPTEVIGCESHANHTENWCPAVEDPDLDYPAATNLYFLSYMYLGTVGFIVCILVGTVVSFMTGAQNPHQLPKNVLFPYLDRQFDRSHRSEEYGEKSSDEKESLVL